MGAPGVVPRRFLTKLIMPQTISCDPSALAALSACYCFDQVATDAATLYLLNAISGLNLSPTQLAANSKCFCLDKAATEAAKLYLLCAISSKVGA
jgi:hypothetical protein